MSAWGSRQAWFLVAHPACPLRGCETPDPGTALGLSSALHTRDKSQGPGGRQPSRLGLWVEENCAAAGSEVVPPTARGQPLARTQAVYIDRCLSV